MTLRHLQRRVARLRTDMDAQGIHALLVSQRENIRYLTGFTGSAGLAIVTSNRLVLVTDFRY
ncbi:MAG TPA: aminopeptidase P family N-terminal domain-containing protein, partial [Nitrospirota bacterium]|nr:aminopeptidase P family N-terminal domain-containing protein [Nitrospirota bacterium]